MRKLSEDNDMLEVQNDLAEHADKISSISVKLESQDKSLTKINDKLTKIDNAIIGFKHTSQYMLDLFEKGSEETKKNTEAINTLNMKIEFLIMVIKSKPFKLLVGFVLLLMLMVASNIGVNDVIEILKGLRK